MSCLFSFGGSSGTISNNGHFFFPGLNGDINIYIIDAGMGEEPHGIPGIKIVSFHDLHTIAFYSFQENKLMHSHFTGDVSKKTKWQFYHRMKAHKTSDAGIHFFNGKCGMPATE